MKIPNDSTKYLSSWKFVETARYIPALSKVIRDKDGENPRFTSIYDMEAYCKKYNNVGIYTSIWHYNSLNINEAIRLGSLYFDLDNSDPDKSWEECKILYLYLQKYIPEKSLLIYFTGKKGFHIECEPIALGINPSNALPNIFRYIASKIKSNLNIESIDFSVYDARRMWRYPGSKHQQTGLYKNLIPKNILFSSLDDIKLYCKTKLNNLVGEQTFDLRANEWFRDFTYDMEINKQRSKDFLAYFNEKGSSAFKTLKTTEKIFTEKELLENCPAINRHIENVKRTHELDHESRLFLCSILSYNEDAIKFLYDILSLCDDFNYEKSASHINDWIKRRQLGIGGRPYTCERANSAGVGCGDCHLEKKKKWIIIGDKFVEGTEVSNPSPIRFAYKNRKENNK